MKPSIKLKCVANSYAATGERIAEFSFPGTSPLAGGLLSLSQTRDGPTIEVYSVSGCAVRAPDDDLVARLREIEEVLADHPDAGTGNTKVHYALMRARSGLARFEKRGSRADHGNLNLQKGTT